jgi:hypothetical protein
VMVSPLNNVFTFRNAHTCLQCTAYQARGGSKFSRQMTLAFRMQKPAAKESGECFIRGIPGIILYLSIYNAQYQYFSFRCSN